MANIKCNIQCQSDVDDFIKFYLRELNETLKLKLKKEKHPLQISLVSLSKFKGPISGLIQSLATELPLKKMKNVVFILW